MSTPRVILFKPSKPKLTVSQLGDWDIISNLTAKELGRELGLHVITGSITLEKAKKIIVTVYRIIEDIINFVPVCWFANNFLEEYINKNGSTRIVGIY